MNNMDNLQELDDRLYTKNAAITPSHFWWILLNQKIILHNYIQSELFTSSFKL